MSAPSLITAARHAPDRRERILAMAAVFEAHRFGPDEACTRHHLSAAGFTHAEIETYADPARAVLLGKPSDLRTTPDGRGKGVMLRRRALAIRARINGLGRGGSRG